MIFSVDEEKIGAKRRKKINHFGDYFSGGGGGTGPGAAGGAGGAGGGGLGAFSFLHLGVGSYLGGLGPGFSGGQGTVYLFAYVAQ